MCPFVDFANHIGDAQQSCEFKPIYTQPIRPGTSPSPPHSITFSSPPVNLKKGDEIFLRVLCLSRLIDWNIDLELHRRYGYHSNTTLFCEYGFVLPRPDWAEAEGDLQLDFLLGPRFQSYPEFKILLEKWGYWEYVLFILIIFLLADSEAKETGRCIIAPLQHIHPTGCWWRFAYSPQCL